MRCPKCGGTGEMQICEMGFIGKDECDKCHGKGYLTNEEWIKSMNTEQLAEWIVHLADDCTMQHECNLCNSWCDEKRVMEWLKQPHTIKE